MFNFLLKFADVKSSETIIFLNPKEVATRVFLLKAKLWNNWNDLSAYISLFIYAD